MAKNLGLLNIGDLIEVPVKPEHHSFLGERIVFKVADKNHPGYPENSVTLITDKIIAAMPFDEKEPTNSLSSRRDGGNNRYLYSNALQWLNSESTKDWYSPQHAQDAPPSTAIESGYLAMLNQDFVSGLLNTPVIVVRHSVDGGGLETVESRMFLASTSEIADANLAWKEEGARLSLFLGVNSQQAYATEIVCKKHNWDSSQPSCWWVRSPTSMEGRTSAVSAGGAFNMGAYVSYSIMGIRPLCNLSDNCPISNSVNERGYYTLYPSEPPSISGTDSDLGTKYEGFSYDYTVTDPESEAVTVTEKVNDTILRTYTPELGQAQTLSLSGEAFSSLPNAVHTITITATDSADNVVTRTLTFTKSISGFEIVLKNPLTATVQPRRVYVDVMREIPAGGSFKVEVTNNPYDPEPVWEDCTMAVLRHLCHIFKNTVNEAEQFGVNVRVTVKRGRALTVCWVSGIEINFE